MTRFGHRYTWREGARQVVEAEVVGATVEKIVAAEGSVTPSRIVQEAEPEDSPLHPVFTWDNDRAATAYRLTEARRLLSSLRVERVEATTGAVVHELAFVNVHGDEEDKSPEPNFRYVTFREVETSGVFRAEVVRTEFARLAGLLRRTDWIEEFAGLRLAAAEVQKILDRETDMEAAAD